MLKKLFDRMFPDSACEDAIVEMSLHRLREAQPLLNDALRADGLPESSFCSLQTEAVACVINASKVAIDLAGTDGKRKPRYEALLTGVYLGYAGASPISALSLKQENVIRRIARHLTQGMETARTLQKPGTRQEQGISMIASLVTASVIELGLGDRECGSCEALLLKLASAQSQHTFFCIMSAR